MPDQILEIGATIDLSQILPGLEKMGSFTQQTTTQMNTSFQSLPSTAGVSISELNITMEKLIASNQAVADSSAAMAGAVMAAMTKVTTATREGATESALSLGMLKREFAEVAESAELSASGAVSAFGPLGAILGVGLLTNYAEKLKEVVLSLDRLASITREPIARLAQFRGALEELGVPSENISRVLLHLTQAMMQAKEGSKTQAVAFAQLGVSTEGWGKSMPSVLDVLMKVSDGLHNYKGGTETAAAATQILGLRMGVDLAGGLTVGSKALEERAGRLKGLGKATEDAVNGAKRLQEAEAEASAKIQEAMLPLLNLMATALTTSYALWLGLKYDVEDAFTSIKLPIQEAVLSLEFFGKISKDIASLNWSAATADSEAYFGSLKKLAMDAAKSIIQHNAEIHEANLKMTEKPPVAPDGMMAPPDVSGLMAGAKTRVQIWKEALDQMKADADNFHAVTSADEMAYWEKILATEKLSAKERLAVHQELNRAKHAAAMDAYKQQIALDDEMIAADKEGTAGRLADVIEKRDHIVAAWGAGSTQAIAANKSVLEEMRKNDTAMAENVVKSVTRQVESYKQGSSERIAIMATAIATLKGMEDNLAAGKMAKGIEEPTAPIAPTGEDDAKLRIKSRENETAEIQKLVDEMTAKLMGDYKAESSEAVRDALQTERERIASINRIGVAASSLIEPSKRTTASLVSEAQIIASTETSTTKRSADERIKEIDRLQGFDLITFNQRIELSRRVLDEEQRNTTLEIARRIDLVKAEEHVASAVIETERIKQSAIIGTAAADTWAEGERLKLEQQTDTAIEGLQRQLAGVIQQIDQRRMQLSDDATNHDLMNANRFASVFSGAFESTFDRMTRERMKFSQGMQMMYRELVQGFERMVAQMISAWIKKQITELALTITGKTQQAAVDTAQTAEHVAQTQVQTGATAASQAEQTALSVAGGAARIAAGAAEDIASIMRAAGVAAAHAFKWVIEEIPFPANIALAAGVAAAVYATVKGFAKAEKGMLVGEEQLVHAHPGEAVLPAHLTTGLQNVISAGAFSTPSGLSHSFSSGGVGHAAANGPTGGNVRHVYQRNEFHLHHNGEDAKQVMERDLVPAIQRAMRRGEIATP